MKGVNEVAKVLLTQEDKAKEKLRNFIRNRSKELGVPQKEMAKACMTDQPYFSRKLSICNFSYVELVKLFNLLHADENDLKEILL